MITILLIIIALALLPLALRVGFALLIFGLATTTILIFGATMIWLFNQFIL